MNNGPNGREQADAILNDEVAFWDARLRSPLCTADDRAAFADWRDGNPAHAAAFARLQMHLESLRTARSALPELRALRDEALGYGRRRNRLTAMAAGLAAAVVGLGVFGVWNSTRAPRPPASIASTAPASMFETAVGERSTIKLSDGSVAVLDTDTRLEVTFKGDERRLRLLRGQALFDVAHDPRRPFVVAVGGQKVTAVGTRFAVRLDPDRVSVTMVQGKTRVGPLLDAPGSERALVAGQRLTSSPDFKHLALDSTGAQDVSWADGRVIFENAPLAQVVEELRRYSETPILIADAPAARIRISGMARTGEPLNFVRALPENFPVALRTDGGSLVLRSAAGRTR